MNRRKKFLLLFSVCACVFALIVGYNIFMTTQEPMTGSSVVYHAEEEVKEAKQKFAAIEPALLVANDLSGKKQISLTFDGMADHDTMLQILEVLAKHQAWAAFFIEGANAAAAPEIMAAFGKGGHTVGNYTYVGVAHAEQLPEDRLFMELCRAQKALQATSGAAPTLFKSAQTTYTQPLLKAVAACGIESAVKTSIFIEQEKLNTPDLARAFVLTLKPGSIVSWRLGQPVAMKEKTTVKLEEKPAMDKKPTLQQQKPADKTPQVGIATALDQFLTALKEDQYDIILVDYFRKFKYIPERNSAQHTSLSKNIQNLWASLHASMKDFFLPRKAYAATLPKAQMDMYEQLRGENDGRLAEEIKMVMTTEQAVPYTFVGLANETAARAVLDKLRLMGVKATFFIMEQEIKKYPHLIDEIIVDGHEIGVALRPPKENASFAEICAEIQRTREALSAQFGVTTDLIKQPWGAIAEQTKEAISAMRMRLIGQTVNVVQAKHKDFTTADEVMSQIFGKAVFSVGRGWIVHFRMDYYTKPELAAEVAELLKKRKIDNIAYRSYGDLPGRNPKNDSAYKIRPVGAVLDNQTFTYLYPVSVHAVPEHLRSDRNDVVHEGESFSHAFRKRYIGQDTVKDGDRMLGFTKDESRRMDLSGLIHTSKPAVFFGLDDWGTDAAINKLLYVFRKHKVQATFFIGTRNILANPNLLRAIAVEGHDIACHTESHLPMVISDAKGRQSLSQSRDQWVEDLSLAYRKLESVVGDVVVNGSPALTRLIRPPTLAISRDGIDAAFATGYAYVVSGSISTNDYDAESLRQMIERTQRGLYEKDTVKKGAIFVMHMSDNAKFTAKALDALLTANEEKTDDDPTKFVVGRLSDFLVEGYDQGNRQDTLALEQDQADEVKP